MKHLLLFFLFSCSLDGFSQDKSLQYCIKHHALYEVKCPSCESEAKPDTIRATLIVYYEKGSMNILHTKPGFVVRQVGKEEVYLDDRKKGIKAPLEVFSYKLKR